MRRISLAIAVLLAALGCLPGCAKHAPTAPVAPAAAPARLDAPSPPGVLHVMPAAARRLAAVNRGDQDDPDPSDWIRIASAVVGPDDAATVGNGRFDLLIDRGALTHLLEITLDVYNPSVLDVELGPHQTRFKKPARLRVSYRDTEADPESPNFGGGYPEMCVYDEKEGGWVTVASEFDPNQLTITTSSTSLEHFSRYAVRVGTP